MSGAAGSLGQPERKRLHREARSLGFATTRGTLYNFRHYPALVDGDDTAGAVHGELFLLTYPKATFSWLDAYEAPIYRRVERVARLASGVKRMAWIYVYLGKAHDSQRIPSGRWHARGGTPPMEPWRSKRDLDEG
jgi:gamma-glutamylcyclotransferase (GGCT)/AIG2-like uncharacterized protein YtfP